MNRQESGYRWVVLGTVLCAYFLMVSQRTAPGLITDQLMRDFHVSAAVIGLTASIQFVAYAALQIPSGLASDRFGPNRFLIAGTFLGGIGSIMYSLAPHESVLMLGRLLVGTGDSMIFVNLVLIMTQWFYAREFVKLIGIVSILGSLGALFATVPFSVWIIEAGWRPPFFITGAILAVLAALLYAVLIWQPRKRFPEDAAGRKGAEGKRKSVWNILRRMVSSRQAWALFLCHFGVVGTYTGFVGSWGVPYAIEVFDMSRLEASRLIMYSLFGSLIGGPVCSWLASRLGSSKKVYVAVHALVFLSWSGWFLSGVTPSYPLVVTFIVITGAGMGASALTFAILRQTFPVDEVGVATGFANSGGFVSAILLPMLYGNVLDLFPQEAIQTGYHYAFLIPVLFSLAGVAGVLLVRHGESAQVRSAQLSETSNF